MGSLTRGGRSEESMGTPCWRATERSRRCATATTPRRSAISSTVRRLEPSDSGSSSATIWAC